MHDIPCKSKYESSRSQCITLNSVKKEKGKYTAFTVIITKCIFTNKKKYMYIYMIMQCPSTRS